MQRIGHVDALPPVVLDREVHEIARLRQESDGVQHLNQRRSDPLGDVRPALLARHLGDLAADRKTPEIGERKRCGLRDHSIDRKPPVRKPAGLVALEGIARGRSFVGERRLRNHAARKLASQRVRRQKPLGGVRQRFAGTVDSAAIGRDQAIAPRQAGRRRPDPRRPRWRRDQW